MGPNGSGKSTLAKSIMGYFDNINGRILFNGLDITKLSIEERSKLGIFLGFQNPIEIEGLSTMTFLTHIAKGSSFKEKIDLIYSIADRLKIDKEMLSRSLNFGFSGGEKKRFEIMQMYLLKPKLAILDEPDSGLDVDSLKEIAKAISDYKKESNASILLITHYSRITNYLDINRVSVMLNGTIVKSGNINLIKEIEQKGYNYLVDSNV